MKTQMTANIVRLTALLVVLSMFSTIAFTVSAAPAGEGWYKVTTNAGLNVRSNPDASYAKVGGISYGASFYISKTSGSWGYADAYKGWVHLDYAVLTSQTQQSNLSSSANISNGYYTIASKLDLSKGIDIDGGRYENGTCAILYTLHGNENQVFYFERLSDGTYKITAKHSGLSLEVRNSSKDNGTDVAQWEYSDGYNCKKWYIVDCGGGYYKFVNKESGKCLDVEGASSADCTRIQQYEDNGTDAQLFKLRGARGNCIISVTAYSKCVPMVKPMLRYMKQLNYKVILEHKTQSVVL